MTQIVEAVHSGLKEILDKPITMRKLGEVALGAIGMVALGEAERIGTPYVGDLWRYMKGFDGDGFHDEDMWTNVVNNGGHDWVYTNEQSALLNQEEYVKYMADWNVVERGDGGELPDCYVAVRDLSNESSWYYDWHREDSGLNEFDWWREQGYKVTPNGNFSYQKLPTEIQPEAQAVHNACRPTGIADEANNVWNYDSSNHERLEEAFGANAATFGEWINHIGPVLMSGMAIWGMSHLVDRTIQAGSPWLGKVGEYWQGARSEAGGLKRAVREMADYALAITAYSLIRGALS